MLLSKFFPHMGALKIETDLFLKGLIDPMDPKIGWMIGQCFIGDGGFLGVLS